MKTAFLLKTSLFTLILALVAIGTFAITAVMKSQVPSAPEDISANQTWHYTGDANPEEFANPANWQLWPSPVTCDNGERLPCQITDVPAENEAQLEQLLLDYPRENIFQIASSKSAP